MHVVKVIHVSGVDSGMCGVLSYFVGGHIDFQFVGLPALSTSSMRGILA